MSACKRCGAKLAYFGAEYCGAACSSQRGIEVFIEPKKCMRCDGCGKIADSDEGEPWTAWEDLPPGSDIAVKMGIVKPIPCPDCEVSP
jgi:hypothetical protein